jgi:ABC-2 type transport system permease protein
MRSVLVIAGVELRRFLRDRSNIFFVLIFPLLLVAWIGAQFGGGANAGWPSPSRAPTPSCTGTWSTSSPRTTSG